MTRATDEIVTELLATPLTPNQLVLLVELLASRIVRDNVRDNVREYEAARKRTQREKLTKSAGKQTMSGRKPVPDKPPNVRDIDKNAVSSLLTQGSFFPSKKVKKEARGQRITREFCLTADLRHFTMARGFDPEAEVAEFIDYWIAVPGQRGTKLDWPATYRNRIRFKSERRGPNGQSRPDRSASAAAGRLVEGIRNGTLSIAPEPRSPSAMQRDGQAAPRLLSAQRRE